MKKIFIKIDLNPLRNVLISRLNANLTFRRQLSRIESCRLQKVIVWKFLSYQALRKFNPRTPLRRKLRMRWFFGVPPQIFDAHLLKNTNLSPSSPHFLVGFYIKIMFLVRCSHWLIFSHIILYKKYIFVAEVAISQRWSAIFCATGL